jgi:hypothetical protein
VSGVVAWLVIAPYGRVPAEDELVSDPTEPEALAE